VNTYFAQLQEAVGPEHALEVARRMGISNIPEPGTRAYSNWNVCSLVLGVKEVSVLDMASAFGVLANRGVRCPAFSIAGIDGPDGKSLYHHRLSCSRVVDGKVAAQATDMLRGVVTGGTGGRATLPGRPVAGKTGTAQDYRSAFFNGFTPQLSASVWVGFTPKPTGMPHLGPTGGPVFGGTYPAMIFHDYMTAALAGAPVLGFPAAPKPPPPPKVKVPDVVGQPVQRAQAILQQAGFGTSVKEVPDAAPKGRVIGQDPKGGSQVPGGTTVALKVSSGKGGHTGDVVIPGVVGLKLGLAKSILAAFGLVTTVAYTTVVGGEQVDRVLSQSPGAGARAPRGSRVNLVVGRRRPLP
jgi:membrane peptidoglycan carboxypeptidase